LFERFLLKLFLILVREFVGKIFLWIAARWVVITKREGAKVHCIVVLPNCSIRISLQKPIGGLAYLEPRGVHNFKSR
jgi:hypothetical protein